MSTMAVEQPQVEESPQKDGTWVHKFKHMGCGLHFEVLSWQEGWEIKCCPECGGTEGFMQWSQQLPGQIFQYVPGQTPMTAITNGQEAGSDG